MAQLDDIKEYRAKIQHIVLDSAEEDKPIWKLGSSGCFKICATYRWTVEVGYHMLNQYGVKNSYQGVYLHVVGC